jgi:hypothetical protein
MSETSKRDEKQIFKDMDYSHKQEGPVQSLNRYLQESSATKKAAEPAAPKTPSPMEMPLPLSQEELERRKKAYKRLD